MNPPRILIAGIGNIFLGDDAFGCETVKRLAEFESPSEVKVIDFGIRSYDLQYALGDGYDAVVLVDAAPRGEKPGTLCLLELDPATAGAPEAGLNGHSLNPALVLQMAAAVEGALGKMYLVGCEPEVLESEDGQFGLSPSVEAAVPLAVEMIRGLVADLLQKK